jgi:pSer/pThr/pTyr-binding forkhead associated (FHA) protein
MLVSQVIGHRVALPMNGELVLGRFDPSIQSKPDVDLTFEDRITRGISRRHAKITGWRGRYAIEDLGSSYGTWVNDKKLDLEKKHILRIGDQVRLGNCTMYFDYAPALWKTPLSANQCFLYATFTGRYFPLPRKESIIIGRADADLGFTPDIDLGGDEAAISAVSRRHLRLTRQDEKLLVEDLGSIQKTQVNGKTVSIGIQVPLSPGQHMWLGGYTIAFDVINVNV